MNLESWNKVIAPKGMSVDPSESGFLTGHVYGHPTIADGTCICTSTVLGWDFRDQCFVDENNNEFRLKEPDPTYEQRFPNAKGRIEKAITDRRFMMSTADYYRRYAAGNGESKD